LSRPVIRVEGLSKLYRIGMQEQRHDTFVASAAHFIMSPRRNLRALRGLTRFGPEDSESRDVVHALRDISFEVPEGEVLGVIGANGAGKSTLLKVLAGITEPSSGRALVRGRVASLLEVGTGFHPELTGRENVYLNGTVLGMRKAEIDQKYDEIVQFAEVGDFMGTPVKRFSSGMRVRLAFAVAAHLSPEILLVDEVLAVGDAAFQRKCLGRMDNVASSGRTILFVSHNVAAVGGICSRGILLDRGRLVEVGPIADVLNSYARRASHVTGRVPQDRQAAIVCSTPLLNGGRTSVVPSEVLAFDWSIGTSRELWEVKLQLSILNSGGACVALPRISSKNQPALKQPGNHSIRVEFPVLWLAPGSYSARVKIFAEGPMGSARYFSDTIGFHVIQDSAVDSAGVEVLQPRCEWSIGLPAAGSKETPDGNGSEP
jgi:lipopolysaccharide transport system ATP-binding protein